MALDTMDQAMVDALDALSAIEYTHELLDPPIAPRASAATHVAVTVAFQHVRRVRAPELEDVDDPKQRLRTLAAMSSIAYEIDCSYVFVVHQARALGATWTEIGTAMGMTKQAAHKRFGGTPDVEVNGHIVDHKTKGGTAR